MDKEFIAAVIGVNGLAVGFFILAYYVAFGGMFASDIRANAGRRTLRRARKKYKGFWKKFLYLDFKDRISRWHYFVFILFMVSFPLTIVFMNLAEFSNNQLFRELMKISCIPCFISLMIALWGRKDHKGRYSRK